MGNISKPKKDCMQKYKYKDKDKECLNGDISKKQNRE
jgi:hypothetical protein